MILTQQIENRRKNLLSLALAFSLGPAWPAFAGEVMFEHDFSGNLATVSNAPSALPRLLCENAPSHFFLGEPLSLNPAIGNVGTASYQWFRNGVAIIGATNNLLYLPTATMADAGVYSLIVSNAYGVSSYTNADVAAGNHDRVAQVSFRPEYERFSSSSGLVLVGTAVVTNQSLRLTDAVGGQNGAVWFPTKLYCRNGFRTRYQFRIWNPVGWGADGFSFNVQTSGLAALPGEAGVGASIAFDTYQNQGDYGTNYVSVRGIGIPYKPVGLSPFGIFLADGKTHTFEATHNGLTINITIDGFLVIENAPMPLDQVLDAFGNGWVGFGGRTGGAYERIEILNWSFLPRSELSLTDSKSPTVQDSTTEIVTSPTSGEIHPGASALLMARAVSGFDRWRFHPAPGVSVPVDPRIGDGDLRYQWSFNGSNLAGQTNASLLLSNIQSSQAGSYSVSVFNHARLDTENLLGSATQVMRLWTGWPVPGMVEAEDFDDGNEGVAFHDSDALNVGGAYRETGVDIVPTTVPDGFKVTSIVAGEWLNYTLNVASNGFYRPQFDLISAAATNGVIHAGFGADTSSNGVSFALPSRFYRSTVIGKVVKLGAGQQTLRISLDTGGFEFDSFTIVPATNMPPTVTLTDPAPGMTMIAGWNIPLGVNAVDSDGWIAYVDYFINGGFISRSSTAPFASASGPTVPGFYTIIAVATDNAGLSATSAPVTISALPLGMLKREVYTGIVGTSLASLTNHAKFPNSPDLVARVFQLELPPNWGDNYGARLSGYLVPPISGAYVFYLASDDEGALFLSTDESPAHKVRIASEPQWNGYREYIKGANQASRGNPPSNISAPILLSAGHSYYIEVLMKEGTGGDNLSVAWKLPGGAAPTNGSAPIATYLQLNSDTVPPVSCVSPPSGLVGWWRGQNNALDSASTNHGTLKNLATFAPGFVGQAFSFDGIGQFVTTGEVGLTLISNNFTIDFWVNPTANRNVTPETSTGTVGTSGQRYAVFPRNGGSANAGIGVSVGTNGISVFEHGGGYLPSTLVYQAPIFGWNHIAVVYLNKQPSLYLNGVWVRTGLISPRAAVHPSAEFGGDASPYGYFAGLLDEPSIYNRSLSPAEIEDVYAAGGQGKCKPTLQILTSDGSFGFISGQFSFRVMGWPGQVIIEATSDLQNWTPIRTNMVGIEPFLFRDIDPAQYPFRYYRAVMP